MTTPNEIPPWPGPSMKDALDFALELANQSAARADREQALKEELLTVLERVWTIACDDGDLYSERKSVRDVIAKARGVQ